MAINIPIITSLEDKGIRAAKDAFSNFRTAVGNAQGGMNKFKAGSKVALDTVAANAGLFAVAGVAAERNAVVYRTPEADRFLRVTDTLDGEDVLPGFRLPLAELFAELSFE